MALEPIYEAETRIVNGLKDFSSSGPDRISTKVVKFNLPVFVSALAKLVNLCF